MRIAWRSGPYGSLLGSTARVRASGLAVGGRRLGQLALIRRWPGSSGYRTGTASNWIFLSDRASCAIRCRQPLHQVDSHSIAARAATRIPRSPPIYDAGSRTRARECAQLPTKPPVHIRSALEAARTLGLAPYVVGAETR